MQQPRAGPTLWRHTRRGDKYVTDIIDLTPARDKAGPARLLDMVEGRTKARSKIQRPDPRTKPSRSEEMAPSRRSLGTRASTMVDRLSVLSLVPVTNRGDTRFCDSGRGIGRAEVTARGPKANNARRTNESRGTRREIDECPPAALSQQSTRSSTIVRGPGQNSAIAVIAQGVTRANALSISGTAIMIVRGAESSRSNRRRSLETAISDMALHTIPSTVSVGNCTLPSSDKTLQTMSSA